MVERNGEELDNGCLIFDVPEEKGIELVIPIGGVDSGFTARVFMDDEKAEEMIRIIQNKLNARRP